jgi:hypothetical protein
MEIPESQNSRDARVEKLWKKLDPQGKGELDLNGLKKGLNRIDHRKYYLASTATPALTFLQHSRTPTICSRMSSRRWTRMVTRLYNTRVSLEHFFDVSACSSSRSPG